MENNHVHLKKQNLANYKPLMIIIIFCLLIPFATIRPFEAQKYMHAFMGYFFIFLSLFKFFDLKGFVEGFSSYDLIAKQLPPYSYVYPFIEFFLGMAYLGEYKIFMVNSITVVIMLISGIGVLISVLTGQKLKCACLGTVLNVPLSTVSILENFGMGAMAILSLIFST